MNYEALRAADVNIQMGAEASAEFFRTKGGSGEYESEEQTELRLLFDGSAERQRAIYVGAPPSSELDFGAWANNIANPIPQTHSLPSAAKATGNYSCYRYTKRRRRL